MSPRVRHDNRGNDRGDDPVVERTYKGPMAVYSDVIKTVPGRGCTLKVNWKIEFPGNGQPKVRHGFAIRHRLALVAKPR